MIDIPYINDDYLLSSTSVTENRPMRTERCLNNIRDIYFATSEEVDLEDRSDNPDVTQEHLSRWPRAADHTSTSQSQPPGPVQLRNEVQWVRKLLIT